MILTADESQALRLTCFVAVTSVLVSLLPGIFLAWLLGRHDFRGKSLLETLLNLPLVLPPVVTGYLLLLIFGSRGFLGHWLEATIGLRFVFDFNGAVLASAIMAFPLLVRPIRLSFANLDRRLELAARTLGAKPWDVFLTVSLPLSYRGIVTGAILAFARAMGEFGATIMIAGSIPGETRTIPLYIYGMLESPDGLARAPVLVAWCIVIASMALVAGNYLERREERIRRSA